MKNIYQIIKANGLIPFCLTLLLVPVSLDARENIPEYCGTESELQMEASANSQEGPYGFQSNFGGNDWQEFFSSKQGFRARFPELPARAKEKVKNTILPLEMETYQTFKTYKKPIKHASGYFLGVANLAGGKLSAKKEATLLIQALDSLQKSYSKGASFSLNKKGKFQGHQAREFVLNYQSQGSQYTLDGVVFLDNKMGRLYQVACLYAPADKRLLSDCDYFFSHFKTLSIPVRPNL